MDETVKETTPFSREGLALCRLILAKGADAQIGVVAPVVQGGGENAAISSQRLFWGDQAAKESVPKTSSIRGPLCKLHRPLADPENYKCGAGGRLL